MGRLFHYIVFGLAIMSASTALAATPTGGSCPSGSNYLNLTTNTLTTLSTLGVTSCYYIAASGSDANSGTSEATPWAHAPGMQACSGNCAITPLPGNGFIFRGGDTVAATYLNITAGGSSTAPIYYGVDKAWYSGTSWNRPILAIGGTLPNQNSYNESRVFSFAAGWVTVDWFEITGGTCSASGPVSQNYFWNAGTYDGIVVTNGYFHYFEAPSGGCGTTALADGNPAEVWIYTQIQANASNCHGAFEYNVVDGTDGTGNKGYMTIPADGPGNCATVAYNVMHDLCSGVTGNVVHDNSIGNFGGVIGQYECASPSHLHNHAIRTNTGDSQIYNNTIYSTEGEIISVNPNNGSPGTFIYNNLLWHNNASAIDICDNGPGACSSGVVSIFNNTIEQQTGGSFVYGNCVNLENNVGSLMIANEHHIFASGSTTGCILAANPPFNTSGRGTAGTLTYDAANNLYQTLAQANAAGYTNTQNYVYSPTASSSPSVGIGVTGIASGEANDTTYACSEATINGVVQISCPMRATVGRATSGACTAGVPGCADAGAWLYSVGGGVNPPTGLTATVQ